MNNFFCNHKTQKSDPEHTFSEIDINYRRDYSKGKSFKVSIWNEIDTYNNDDFIQDFVIYNQSLWARIDSTPSTNEVPTEGPWTKVMDGVSDVQFKEEGNKIFWKYEDESEWKDLFELDVVSESEIKNMLKDIATDVDSNFYDKTLSETSVNAVQNKVITQALNKKADKTELSKKQDVISDLSEIRNKAKSALQSVPSEYVTESELANKGYLTEHQDISGKQDKIADLAQIRANAQKGATALQFVPEKYATKIYVSNEVAKIVNSAPKAFDTLKEIADWIEEDAEPAIVLANKVEQKADKTDVAEALAKKADKSEIPTKMSQLEQDVEIGSSYDDTEVKNELAKLEREKANKPMLISIEALGAPAYQAEDESMYWSKEQVEAALSMTLSELYEQAQTSEVLVDIMGQALYPESTVRFEDDLIEFRYPIHTPAVSGFYTLAIRQSPIDLGGVNTAIMLGGQLEEIATKQELTELSGAISLRNVGAVDTDESVEEPEIGGGGMSTPSGDPMHYMFEAVGATYNATDADIPMVGIYGDSYVHKAKHWHLNELGDITNEEMRRIYLYANLDNGAKGVAKYLASINTRTNIATWYSSWNGKIKDQEVFAYADKVIVARLRDREHYIDSNASFAFTGCKALQKILPTLDATSTTSFNGIFENCNNLREVRIKNVKVAIKFNASPLISKASILYLIQNSAATSAMVITLHADAYARLAEDADIVAALAEKTNVSLASA